MIDLLRSRLGLACQYDDTFTLTPVAVQESVSLGVQHCVSSGQVCYLISISEVRYHDSVVLPERSSHCVNCSKADSGADDYADLFTKNVNVCLISILSKCGLFLDDSGSMLNSRIPVLRRPLPPKAIAVAIGSEIHS